MTFDFYGLRVDVRGDWPEVTDAIGLDLAWFKAEVDAGPAQVEVSVERGAPELDGFGDVRAAFVTPRYSVFEAEDVVVVDYGGSAVATVEENGDRFRIRGERAEIVQEAVYSFLLGRAGDHLDSIGLVRMHGLGLTGAGGGVLVLLPTGGGKSTLAVQALLDREAGFLSDDSPLLDRQGRLHPFPLRVAVNQAEGLALPVVPSRPVPTPGAGDKFAIEIAAFADRVGTKPLPLRHVVLGRRSLGRSATLEPLPRRAAVVPLLVHGVVGAGLYQGLGYAHQRGAIALLEKVAVAASRARSCYAGLRGAQVWRLTLGRDRLQNWETLRRLLG